MFSACPMWREPVTFGGGMTIVYGSPGRDGSAWKEPAAIQAAYQRSSTDFGSYGFSFCGSFSFIRGRLPGFAADPGDLFADERFRGGRDHLPRDGLDRLAKLCGELGGKTVRHLPHHLFHLSLIHISEPTRLGMISYA